MGSVITSAMCAVVMFSLWRQNRRRFPELGYWLFDPILQFGLGRHVGRPFKAVMTTHFSRPSSSHMHGSPTANPASRQGASIPPWAS